MRTLKRCFKGNNMWAVQEAPNGITFAVLYLIKGPAYGNKNDRDGWGYKDVDETMGPYKHDFPVSWLDLLSPVESEYAVEWRERVRKQAEFMAQLKLGTTWKRLGSTYTILKRRSPTSLLVEDGHGVRWRMNPRMLLGAEEVK